MYARSSTIHADPQQIDRGIAYCRDELMPMLMEMQGCVGLSLLCDRDSGRCIATSSWETEEAMRATTERVRDMRQRAADMMGGGRDMQVDEWEVTVMHRDHMAGDDACARVTWCRCDPATMERMIDTFRMREVPRMDEVSGHCSVSMMCDRNTGRCTITSVYEDRRAMEASRDQAMSMREAFMRDMDMEMMEVAEFELAIHHLRVPELV